MAGRIAIQKITDALSDNNCTVHAKKKIGYLIPVLRIH